MKNYAGKWILQRATAIVLVPLTFWFVYNCISFSYLSFDEIIFFFSSMLNSFLFLILMMSMFLHAKIGCETILDDYITSKSKKKISKYSIKVIFYVCMSITVFSVIKINLL
tara:strand:+ start:50 stop:382 length:333 start_codon:yes stop_codon:yes gene_type:complete